MADMATNDLWSWLTGPSQNTIGTVGGNPITLSGQSPIGGLLTSGLDIWSLITGQDRKTTDEAINLAYPLNKIVPQAQSQMSQFLTDPSSFLKDPAFTSAEGIGAENVARLSGASGMGNSGNKMADLFKYGTSFGLGFENQKFNQLLSLLGGSPEAGKLDLAGTADQNKTIGDLIASLFGGGGVQGLFNQAPNLMKLLGIGNSGGGGFGGFPIGSAGNPAPLPGDPTPGGGGSIGGFPIGGFGDPGGPMDPGFGGDLGLNF